jgi:anaerobic C4-dicarboxylate transporter
MNSLKSRIRTSRELAVLGLPAALGIVIHQSAAPQWIYIPIVLNLLLFIITVWIESNIVDKDSKQSRWQLERTRTHDLSKKEGERRDDLRRAEVQARLVSIPYYLLIVVSTVTIGIIAELNPENRQIPIIGAGGFILSMLALWTCLTITRTYIRFVAREMPAYLKEKGE